jgi:hypothetical protein
MRLVRRGNIDRAQELIPLAKYFLFRHRELMKAGELESLRNSVTLKDGSTLKIRSHGNFDTVEITGVGRAIEKRPEAEEMVVPENALIWTGLADQVAYPPIWFTNLSNWWASTVIPASVLPTNELFNRRLLYIHCPQRALTTREVDDILLWKEKVVGSKVVIQNAYGNASIVSNINTILEQLQSPLRLQQMYKNLERNYDWYNPGTKPWEDLSVTYSGATSLWRFNNLVGSFLSRGINDSVGVADSTLTGENSILYMADPEDIPVLASGPVGLYARIWVGWPWYCSSPYQDQWAKPEYWEDEHDPDVDWTQAEVDELQALWDPSYGMPEAWLTAYYDNIMLFACDGLWHGAIASAQPQYINAQFATALLVQKWLPAALPFPLGISYAYAHCPQGQGYLPPIQT